MENETIDLNLFQKGTYWKVKEGMPVVPKITKKFAITSVRKNDVVEIFERYFENIGGNEVLILHCILQNRTCGSYSDKAKQVIFSSFVIQALLLNDIATLMQKK